MHARHTTVVNMPGPGMPGTQDTNQQAGRGMTEVKPPVAAVPACQLRDSGPLEAEEADPWGTHSIPAPLAKAPRSVDAKVTFERGCHRQALPHHYPYMTTTRSPIASARPTETLASAITSVCTLSLLRLRTSPSAAIWPVSCGRATSNPRNLSPRAPSPTCRPPGT